MLCVKYYSICVHQFGTAVCVCTYNLPTPECERGSALKKPRTETCDAWCVSCALEAQNHRIYNIFWFWQKKRAYI